MSLLFILLLKLTLLTAVSAGITFKDTSSLGWDSDVKQFAGYVDVDNSQNSLFYWFFESRNDPKTDPIVVWLNGGPGCSSMKALWLVAPGIIQKNLSHIYNPYAWNSNASIIFLDQPAGTGLSTVNNDVHTSKAIGQQMYEFFSTFFETFPEYKDLDFHLIGQSDAGYVLADIAAEILSHDDRLFNLTSLVIGNGLINTVLQYQYIQPMLCGDGGLSPVLSSDNCAQMDLDTPICVDKLVNCNENGVGCAEALDFCNKSTMDKLPGNYFNLKEACDNSTKNCYPQDTYYEEYMNLPNVLETLGSRKTSFTSCNTTVAALLAKSGTHISGGEHNLTTVLTEGVPLMIFAGDLDGTYNWLGNRAVAMTIAWHGQDDFVDAKPVQLVAGGVPVGELTNHDNLSFVRVFQAGHLIAHDKPEVALALINTWLSGDYSFMSLRAPTNETLKEDDVEELRKKLLL